MKEWLELQSTLKPDSIISDVEWINNKLQFKVDGHLFSTFGNMVHHEKHPVGKILDRWAWRHNTPEGLEEEEKNSEETHKKIHLFLEYRGAFLASLFKNALEIREKYGEIGFLQFVDKYVDITTEEDGDKVLAEIVEEHKKKNRGLLDG